MFIVRARIVIRGQSAMKRPGLMRAEPTYFAGRKAMPIYISLMTVASLRPSEACHVRVLDWPVSLFRALGPVTSVLADA